MCCVFNFRKGTFNSMDIKKLVFVGLLTAAAFGQVAPEVTPKEKAKIEFKLSKEEQLKLDNLKLRKENLMLQVQIADKQLGAELSAYVSEVLVGHGSPTNIKFDQANFSFNVEEATVPAPAVPAKKK